MSVCVCLYVCDWAKLSLFLSIIYLIIYIENILILCMNYFIIINFEICGATTRFL